MLESVISNLWEIVGKELMIIFQMMEPEECVEKEDIIVLYAKRGETFLL